MRLSLRWSRLATQLLRAGLATWLCGAPYTANADAVTDWDTNATAVASPAAIGQRELAIVDLAMFDAANSIDRRYRPYLTQLESPTPVSAEAAVASAAATALIGLHPDLAASFKTALTDYLGRLHVSEEALANGQRLGAQIAERQLVARATDGSPTSDSYRPRTRPGQYVPTVTMVGWSFATMHPFVLERPSQFRPGPPPALSSREWAADYNEVKELGSRTSTKRTAEQTEVAKFWLMVGPQAYHPLGRELVSERHMSLVDSARVMALIATSLADAYIAVFDAKYHYEFWRPITAIRNGDIDGNPDTEMDPTWQPLDATPMHPEYPCAHCILSTAAQQVLQSLAGSQPLPEFWLTSPTAPGVTHHWSNLDDFTAEVANARVWAGFHYRNSARVGAAMGVEVAHYVLAHALQPQ
jgi:PAP2 superfamily